MENEDPADRLSPAPSLAPAAPAKATALEYQSAVPIEPERFPGGSEIIKFMVSFLGGIGVSSVAWFSGASPGTHTMSQTWIVGVLVGKVTLGIILSCFRRSSVLGFGLLCSILVGCLVFGFGFSAQCGRP